MTEEEPLFETIEPGTIAFWVYQLVKANRYDTRLCNSAEALVRPKALVQLQVKSIEANRVLVLSKAAVFLSSWETVDDDNRLPVARLMSPKRAYIDDVVVLEVDFEDMPEEDDAREERSTTVLTIASNCVRRSALTFAVAVAFTDNGSPRFRTRSILDDKPGEGIHPSFFELGIQPSLQELTMHWFSKHVDLWT